MLALALAAGTAASLLAVVLGIRLSRARNALREARRRVSDAAAEAAAAHRAADNATIDHQFVSRVVRALPYFIHELHGGVGRRDVPQLLLDTVVRLLSPSKAMVAVARRPESEGGPPQLAVAAVWPPLEPHLGKAIAVGEGEIGFALEVRRVLDRADFDGQPAPLRARLSSETPQGWQPDLVAPLVFKENLAGVIALQSPSRNPAELKDVLRVLAHLGAVALDTNARFDEMKASADTDGLTGLANRRSVATRLAEEVRLANARGHSLSVFLFDVDDFKHYNDRNGHLAGDSVLQALSRLAREHTRPDTILGRFGGEEFLMVFPRSTRGQALAAAEHVRKAIARHGFAHAGTQPLGCLSVSGGVAELPRDATNPRALLRAADHALYAAKRAGRNRVFTYEPAPAERASGMEEGWAENPWYVSWEDAEVDEEPVPVTDASALEAAIAFEASVAAGTSGAPAPDPGSPEDEATPGADSGGVGRVALEPAHARAASIPARAAGAPWAEIG
jgi:diguanylate cyclase (GGDEF)-like protein